MCPVVGVTGSTGKTTTKDFLGSVLGTRMRVVATEGNMNNELGVPLTVMRAGRTRSARCRNGDAGRGTDCPSRRDRPSDGWALTNVGVSHIEVLGSEEAIAIREG